MISLVVLVLFLRVGLVLGEECPGGLLCDCDASAPCDGLRECVGGKCEARECPEGLFICNLFCFLLLLLMFISFGLFNGCRCRLLLVGYDFAKLFFFLSSTLPFFSFSFFLFSFFGFFFLKSYFYFITCFISSLCTIGH